MSDKRAFYTATTTNQGLALIAKQQLSMKEGAELLTIPITRAVVGEGYVDPEDLHLQTEVTDPVGEMDLGPRELLPNNDRAVRLRLRISSSQVAKTALIRQIGVYAQDPDVGEILYKIQQYELPQPLPTTDENYGAVAFFESEQILIFANGDAVAIETSPGWFLSEAELDAHNRDPEAHLGRITELERQLVEMTAWQKRQDERLDLLEDTLITDTEVRGYITFDGLGEIELIRGVYNESMKRLEC